MKKALCVAALLICTGPAHAGKKNKKNKQAEPAATEQPAPAAAAPSGEMIVLPCDWEVGTTFHYDNVRKRTDSTKPMLSGVTSTTPVQVEVTQGGNPAHLTYTVGDTQMDGPDDVVNAAKDMLGDAKAPPMKLVMTDGTVDQIANLEEIVGTMESMMKKMVPPDAPPGALDQMMGLFRNPATATPLLLRDAGKLFSLHCIAVQEDTELSAPIAHPNPFGGPPLEGTSTVRVTAVDADTLTLETEDRVSPEAIAKMLPALMKQFAPEGAAMDEAQLEALMGQMPPIDNKLDGKMVYSRADGFPISVEVHQQVGADDHPMKRTDTWIWTRTEAPADAPAAPDAE